MTKNDNDINKTTMTKKYYAKNYDDEKNYSARKITKKKYYARNIAVNWIVWARSERSERSDETERKCEGGAAGGAVAMSRSINIYGLPIGYCPRPICGIKPERNKLKLKLYGEFKS